MRKKETPNPSRVRGRGVEVSETLFYVRMASIMKYPRIYEISINVCNLEKR